MVGHMKRLSLTRSNSTADEQQEDLLTSPRDEDLMWELGLVPDELKPPPRQPTTLEQDIESWLAILDTEENEAKSKRVKDDAELAEEEENKACSDPSISETQIVVEETSELLKEDDIKPETKRRKPHIAIHVAPFPKPVQEGLVIENDVQEARTSTQRLSSIDANAESAIEIETHLTLRKKAADEYTSSFPELPSVMLLDPLDVNNKKEDENAFTQQRLSVTSNGLFR